MPQPIQTVRSPFGRSEAGNIEYDRYLADHDKPNGSFVYHGIKVEIKKHIDMGIWNGYLFLTNLQADLLQKDVHGGWTYQDEHLFGFDTCHGFIDFIPSLYLYSGYYHPGSTYKNYDWMVQHIKHIIDKLG